MKKILLLLFPLLLHPLFAQHPEMQKLRDAEIRRYLKLAQADPQITAGMDDYDARWYGLDIRLSKNDPAFGGSVTMRFTALVDGFRNVDMTFYSAGTVDSVVAGGAKLPFTTAGGILTVTLAAPLAKNTDGQFQVYYRSPYQGSAFTRALRPSAELGTQITSLSTQAEPFDARKWWPCKDDTRDKADSVDVRVTIEKDMFPVSNGSLVSDVDNGDGTHTVSWHESYPIATYLVSVAAADFSVRGYSFARDGKTMPVYSWYYTRDSVAMRPYNQAMLDGLRIYSDLFITYPFINEKYAMAEYIWGGAMEHQTATSMGFYGEGVVVHELSHQWFGDKVTCAGFEHIWLNEGWATYCEALYDEVKYGVAARKADMQATAYYGPGTIIIENPLTDNIFDGNLSYNKGGWVLHMLRHVVGDSAFFRGVRNYLGGADRDRYRSATTQEFQGYIEAASGYNLNNFIRNWIYGEYYPTYKFDWSAQPAGGNYAVTVAIKQMYIPQRQIFDMPIDLTFRLGGRDTTVVVRDSTENASFTVTLPFQPEVVLLDKDEWILKKLISPITNPTFDKGILLVNGVDWDVSAYTNDIKTAVADSIFTGTLPYTFWDLFPNPSAGYPANVQAVAGSGALASNLIGQYCAVVWVGNEYNGDDIFWANSPILEYIKAGGNVILLTRQGSDFVDVTLLDLLGVTWTDPLATAGPYIGTIPGLVRMPLIGQNDRVSLFTPTSSRPESQVIFVDSTGGVSQGSGVWAKPRLIDGVMSGNFIFLSMRPYRINHQALRRNMDYLLRQTSCAPATRVETDQPAPDRILLAQNYPNPLASGGLATIDFYIPRSASAGGLFTTLKVYDALGREVRVLYNALAEPGAHSVQMTARDLPAGLYRYRLTAGAESVCRDMIVLR